MNESRYITAFPRCHVGKIFGIRNDEVVGMAMDMHEYLRLRCMQMVVMERDILQLTGEMSKESRDNWLVHRLREHVEVLRLRIITLEALAKELGGLEGPEENAITRGMLQVHHRWMAQRPPQDIIDLHNTDSSVAISGMMLGLYQGMQNLARAINADETNQTVEGIIRQEFAHQRILLERLPSLAVELAEHLRKAA